jgi:hypothetical protein
MGYDVDRQPGESVGRQARRHSRGAYLIVALLGLVSLLHALSPNHTIIGGVAVLVAVALLKVIGERKLDLAVRWRKGWAAERSVGDEFNHLRGDGFIVMHDVPQRGEGNIDHISGPTGAYMIETKARGYQSDQLVKARRQAAKLNAELGTWVTPVICLNERDSNPFRHDRVWIVPRQHLLDWIRKQTNRQVPFERLATYAADPSS